jgi:hypothetical protein
MPTSVAALSKDQVHVESGDHTRVAFIRDATGKVDGAVLNPGPWEQRGALAAGSHGIYSGSPIK